MPKILLTGGGTAGHVTPNLALVPLLKNKGFEIEYMGSYDGIEKKLAEGAGIKYTGIDSGKLRRYLSLKNLTDPAHILHGEREAKKYMKAARPDIIFSKGGFVTVPVVFAAHKYKIPVVIHESDLSPGLANKLCIPKADVICYSFPETEKYLGGKGVHTGLPIRESLLKGERAKGLSMCGFDGADSKPLLLVLGGSLGSVNINNALEEALEELLKDFKIAHIRGKGKTNPELENISGYKQFEYVNAGMGDLLAAGDMVVSRAGANSICELEALRKPALLVPLGASASRGDQILNAASFKERGFSETLPEEELTRETLINGIKSVYENREKYIKKMEEAGREDAAEAVVNIITGLLNNAPSD